MQCLARSLYYTTFIEFTLLDWYFGLVNLIRYSVEDSLKRRYISIMLRLEKAILKIGYIKIIIGSNKDKL